MEKSYHVFAVYETDLWLTRSSMVCKGIFSSTEEAINAVVTHWDIPQNECPYPTEILNKALVKRQLRTDFQTSGWSVNYVIQPYEINEWD